MFSGIIEHLGTVRSAVAEGGGRRFSIEAGDLAEGCRPGDSLAVNGVCLTASAVEGHVVTADAVSETLSKTNLGGLREGSRVNLERSLSADGRLHGHIVQGHVDGVTRVIAVQRLAESVLMEFALPDELGALVVARGSVALDGVSLTVARLTQKSFTVSLIGFTLEHTTLGLRRTGDIVNIETDVIGKYVVAALQRMSGAGGSVTEEKLRGWGY